MMYWCYYVTRYLVLCNFVMMYWCYYVTRISCFVQLCDDVFVLLKYVTRYLVLCKFVMMYLCYYVVCYVLANFVMVYKYITST